MVLQDIGIGQLVHRGDPVPQTGGRVGGTLRRAQITNIGPGHVHAAIAATENHEEKNHDHEGDQRGDQRGQESGQRASSFIGILATVSLRVQGIAIARQNLHQRAPPAGGRSGRSPSW